MDLQFLFERGGNTVTSVATAAEVNPSTASRWKDGRKAEWPQIVKLYARGLITDEDLRVAGLAIPRGFASAQEPPPASVEAPEPEEARDPRRPSGIVANMLDLGREQIRDDEDRAFGDHAATGTDAG